LFAPEFQLSWELSEGIAADFSAQSRNLARVCVAAGRLRLHPADRRAVVCCQMEWPKQKRTARARCGNATKRNWTSGQRWAYDFRKVVAMDRLRICLSRLGWASGGAAAVKDSKTQGLVPFLSASVCALIVALLISSPAAMAQKGGRGGAGPAPTAPSGSNANPDAFPAVNPDTMSIAFTHPADNTGVTSGDAGALIDSEACILWTESSIRTPVVSSKRLTIPWKAVSEYQKGCAAYKSQKFSDAESHLHKAVEVYPDYAAAYVVLGQVLVTEKKNDDAKTACWTASQVDPSYVAPYLCLAEFAAKESDWDQVAKLSTQALAIDPLGNPYSLYYAADAGLHQHQLVAAEKHAQEAVKVDENNRIPSLHLLLAQIYQISGNVPGETAQLKDYLKVAANSNEAPRARDRLAKLETAPPTPGALPAAPAAK
jgi:tetratricopeptide (TPR) repeat protein